MLILIGKMPRKNQQYQVNGWGCKRMVVDTICWGRFPQSKLKRTSHYHKSGDFQDNTANREFFGLTQDWAFRSWGISAVRFSGYYGSISNGENVGQCVIGGIDGTTLPIGPLISEIFLNKAFYVRIHYLAFSVNKIIVSFGEMKAK